MIAEMAPAAFMIGTAGSSWRYCMGSSPGYLVTIKSPEEVIAAFPRFIASVHRS
jgi:hypothetical protein